MKTHQKESESITEIKRQRNVNRSAGTAMALLLVALLAGSGATSSPNQALSVGDIAWGVLSVTAFAILLASLYIAYRQADERQRLIQLKAASVTGVALVFGLVTAQILHALDVVGLHITVQIIVIGGILLWMTALKTIERRSNA